MSTSTHQYCYSCSSVLCTKLIGLCYSIIKVIKTISSRSSDCLDRVWIWSSLNINCCGVGTWFRQTCSIRSRSCMRKVQAGLTRDTHTWSTSNTFITTSIASCTSTGEYYSLGKRYCTILCNGARANTSGLRAVIVSIPAGQCSSCTLEGRSRSLISNAAFYSLHIKVWRVATFTSLIAASPPSFTISFLAVLAVNIASGS